MVKHQDGVGASNDYNGYTVQTIENLFDFVSSQSNVVNSKLEQIKAAGSQISISDMFELQIKMNRLSQLSEMSTSVVSAANSSIMSMARNVK